MSNHAKSVIITFVFLSVLVSAIIAQVDFDFAERAYVRQIAKNQIVMINAINLEDLRLKEIASFMQTEMPSQVNDYLSKVPKK